MPNTIEEIKERYESANSIGDLDAMEACASAARALGSEEGLAVAELFGASALLSNEQYQTALEVLAKLEPFFRERNDSHSLALLLNSRGNALSSTDQSREAFAAFTEAQDHAARAGFARIESAVLNNIGLIHSVRGEYAESIEFYQRALQKHIAIGHLVYEANTTQMLGAMFYMVGIEDRAEAYLMQSLEARLRTKDTVGLMGSYSNMAYLHIQRKDLEQALKYVGKGLALLKETSHVEASANLLSNAIIAYADSKMFDEVDNLINTYDEQLSGESEWLASREFVLGQRCKDAGDLEGAVQHVEVAIGHADQHRLPDFILRCHEELRDIAKDNGDFDTYIRHNDAAQKIREKNQGAETARKVAYVEHQRAVAEERKEAEKQKAILYSTLPKHVADRMVQGKDVTDHIDDASVLFLDIVGFTTISDKVPPGHVVHLLKAIFKVCDAVCRKYGLTKIKTIGDSYLAASGVPEQLDDHANRAAQAALAMMSDLDSMQLTMDPELGDTSWTKEIPEINVRIGLHSGPVVAGVVGDEQLQYDIWGDTVNTASRMESTGEAKHIQASADFVSRLTTKDVVTEPRGSVEVKGKGAMDTYWVNGR